jgi:undecaprenyl diphosphate synthase
LSLYSFSLDNWQRPREEVDALMGLYARYLARERPTMSDHNIRFRHVGRRDGLPASVLREIDESARATAGCTGMYLCLALNYGSRAEIADAVRRIARRVADGQLRPDDIDDALISQSLDTRGVSDPDLLIRTSGELRVSNFLLWQLSYAEFYVTQTYWPDFTEEDFRVALRAYAARSRRFGRVDPPHP